MASSSSRGTAAALEEMFQVRSDAPSTPMRSLTGEVKERTIWAYWAQGYEQMPEFFKLCVGTWQRLNPHWDVRVLDKASVHEYVSEAELPNRFMQMLSHQTASDAIRLALLSRYGGVWLDVNIILLTSLDRFCWDKISSGRKSGAVFFHPFYGTEVMGGEDFVESWFMASKPGNPFFLQWRDLFRELFHNRLDIKGLMQHPLYQGLDLEGFDRLNKEFSGAGHDFREYLAIHAMCHRMIETDPQARAQWRDEIMRVNAADTAFRMQVAAQAVGLAAAQVLLSEDPRADELVADVPLIKFTTPHYGPLLFLNPGQLQDTRHLLGRLLDPQRHRVATSPGRSQRVGMRATALSTQRGSRPFSALAAGAAAAMAGLCGVTARRSFSESSRVTSSAVGLLRFSNRSRPTGYGYSHRPLRGWPMPGLQYRLPVERFKPFLR